MMNNLWQLLGQQVTDTTDATGYRYETIRQRTWWDASNPDGMVEERVRVYEDGTVTDARGRALPNGYTPGYYGGGFRPGAYGEQGGYGVPALPGYDPANVSRYGQGYEPDRPGELKQLTSYRRNATKKHSKVTDIADIVLMNNVRDKTFAGSLSPIADNQNSKQNARSNVIITAEKNTYNELQDTINENWTVIFGRSLQQIFNQLSALYNEGTIKNLAFIHHGGNYCGVPISARTIETWMNALKSRRETYPSLDEDALIKITIQELSSQNPKAMAQIAQTEWLYRIFKLLSSEATYISVGCSEAAIEPNAPKQISSLRSYETNVYMSTNFATIGYSIGEDTRIGKWGSIMNIPVTNYKSFRNSRGWLFYNSSIGQIIETGKDLVLRSEGLPFIEITKAASTFITSSHFEFYLLSYYSKKWNKYFKNNSKAAETRANAKQIINTYYR